MEKLVYIPVDSIKLEWMLEIKENSKGLVIFSHGAGSSRKSPRNNYVANVLREAGLSTLLFDLLTEEEDQVYENRFEIGLLTERLKEVTKWLKNQKELKDFKLGYFGSSTGAASALNAAADFGDEISAVVSRGGRPDLSKDFLPQVKAPTLFIVGGNDDVVIELNQQAYDLLKTEKELSIIPGATHLFEEPGTLEEVAKQAASFFKKQLLS